MMISPSVTPILVHVTQGTAWWPVLLGGVVGSFVGVLGAAAVAWAVFTKQRRSDQTKAKADATLQEARMNRQHQVTLTTQALVAVGEMQRIVMSGIEGNRSDIGAARAAIGQWTITYALLMTVEPNVIADLLGLFSPAEEFLGPNVLDDVAEELTKVATKLDGVASALSMKLRGLTGVKHALSTLPTAETDTPADDPSTDG